MNYTDGYFLRQDLDKANDWLKKKAQAAKEEKARRRAEKARIKAERKAAKEANK